MTTSFNISKAIIMSASGSLGAVFAAPITITMTHATAADTTAPTTTTTTVTATATATAMATTTTTTTTAAVCSMLSMVSVSIATPTTMHTPGYMVARWRLPVLLVRNKSAIMGWHLTTETQHVLLLVVWWQHPVHGSDNNPTGCRWWVPHRHSSTEWHRLMWMKHTHSHIHSHMTPTRSRSHEKGSAVCCWHATGRNWHHRLHRHVLMVGWCSHGVMYWVCRHGYTVTATMRSFPALRAMPALTGTSFFP